MKNIIRKKFKEEKCNRCRNKNELPEKDKCNIKVFQMNNYLYCKCENCTDIPQEIRMEL